MSVKPAVDGEHLTLRVSWKAQTDRPDSGAAMALTEPDFIERDADKITAK